MPRHLRDFATDRRLLYLSSIAIAIGGISTLAAFVLLHLIRLFTNLFFFQNFSFVNRSPALHTLGPWVIAVPVVGGIVIGLLARFGSDKIRGHGIPEAIEAILFGKSRMSPKIAILKPLASGIAIGSGGPFGAEGPIIMTGGAIGSLIAQNFSMSAAERKTLLVAGATAGMTAVFGTPLAAVLLAVELLLFEWRPRSLLPVVLACGVAGFCRPYLMDAAPLFPLHTEPAGMAALLICVVAGLLSGMLSAGMSIGLYQIEDWFAKLPVHWMWWPAIGGLAIGLGGYFQPRALGIGFDVINDLLQHHLLVSLALSILVVKAIIWMVALGSGTSGGVLAPLLMLGAGLGTVLASLIPGSDPSLWPLVCMAAVLAGVLGAPLTATVLAVGLTGDFNAMLPLLLASGISYGFTVLAMRRSIMTEKIARRGRHIFREYGVDPLERIFVEEVMSKDIISVPAHYSLRQVEQEFFGEKQMHRAFPVVNEDGAITGMVDRALLQSALLEHDAESSISTLPGSAKLCVLPNVSCHIAARKMAVAHVERIAVVSDMQSMRLVGILSRSDLVKPNWHAFHEEEVREKSSWLGSRSG